MSEKVSVKEAIEKMGGASALSIWMNVPIGSIYQWAHRGYVGPKHYHAFLSVCKKAQIRVCPVEVMKGKAK